jgi:hypothetical protein
VRSADERETRENALGTENPSQQRLVAIARGIVVTITKPASKFVAADPLSEKRGENPCGDARAPLGWWKRAHVKLGPSRRSEHAGMNFEGTEQCVDIDS